jgi:dipeptidyl aminopeptidase/acylaminoacyl peptidase
VCLLHVATLRIAVAAQPPEPALFFNRSNITIARLSPSGEHLALAMRSPGGRYVAVVVSSADPTKGDTVARSEVADVVNIIWVNDKRLVVVIADLQGDHRIANLQGGVFAVDFDGSHSLEMISGDWNFNPEATGSAVRSRILPAQFTLLASTNDGSDDIIVGEREFDRIDHHVTQVTPYRFNTRTRQLSGLLDEHLPELGGNWLFDDSGVPRVYSAHVRGRRIVYTRDPEAKQWREIGNFDANTGEGFVPAFLGYDGILYVVRAEHSDVDALYRYNLRTNKLDDEPVFRVKGFDYGGNVELDPQAKKVVGLHFHADAEGTVWIDPRFKEYQARIDKALPATVNSISCGNCLSSKFLLVRASSDREPPRFLLFDTATGRLVVVGESHPGIKPAQMGERNFFRFAARDGLAIPVYVTLPPGKLATPPPAVVMVHGGPWLRGATWEWSPEAQFLASRGYAVIEPEFRGSRGYGFQLFKAGWRQWGLAMQDDLADAAAWAIAKGFADPKRIAIGGASYGGYAVLMGLIRDPERFRCGFEWVGVTDIGLMYSVSWSDLSEDWLEYGLPQLVGDREKDRDQLQATSPLQNASRLRQPLLMAYGGLDRRVPIIHGTEFRDAVRKTNDHVEWIDYPDEGHGWYKDEDNIDFWKRVEKFLGACLTPPN